MKLTDEEKSFLKLVERSPDRGEGWRQCTEATWPLVEKFSRTELVERDEEKRKIRLTARGRDVLEYLV